jgi:hypothetical protein
MQITTVTIALLTLALIGVALVWVATGIYSRLGLLIRTLEDLRELAAGNQGELVKTQEGIGKVSVDLGRLMKSADATSQIVRSVTGLPRR